MIYRRTTRGILFALLIAAGAADSRQPVRVTHLLQNDFSALLVVDSVLVAAGNNSLYTAIFDTATEQFQPFALADFAGPAVQVKRQDQFVIVRSTAGALTFLDATVLPQIAVLGGVFPPVGFYDFSIAGDILYLACGFEGVRSYELNGYNNVTLSDSSLEPVHAIAVAFRQGRLYVVDDYTGLWRFQPLPNAIGISEGVTPFDSSATAVAISNDSIFVGTRGHGIVVLRQDLSNLEVLDTLPALFESNLIQIVDTFALSVSVEEMAADLSGLGGSHQPILFDSSDKIGGSSTFLINNNAYVLWPTLSGGLNLINLTHGVETQFESKDANPCSGTISDIVISESEVIASRTSGATLRCRVDSVNGRLVTSPLLPGLGEIASLSESEGRVYLLSSERNAVAVAVSTGGEYQITALIDLPSDDFKEIRVTERIHDSVRLLAALGPSTVELFKISNDQSITSSARLYFPESPGDITTVDSVMIISGKASAYVYSLDANLFPSYKSTIYVPSSSGAIVRVLAGNLSSGQLTIVGEEVVRQYDVTRPSSPTETGYLELYSTALDAAQSGDQVYVATRDDGLLRISAPVSGSPTITDSVRLIGNRLAVSGSRVALASDHGVWLIDWDAASDVFADETGQLPGSFALSQNYPNPFNPETVIEFTLEKPSCINLAVYNSLGQTVGKLADGLVGSGRHRLVFDGGTLASGIYFYRLTTPDGVETRKMVLVR